MSLRVLKAKVDAQRCRSGGCVRATEFHVPRNEIGGNVGANLPRECDGCDEPVFDAGVFRTGVASTNASSALRRRLSQCSANPIFKLNQRDARTNDKIVKCVGAYDVTDNAKVQVSTCGSLARNCKTFQKIETMPSSMYLLHNINNRACLTSALHPNKVGHFNGC